MDIWDRIMQLPILRIFEPLYARNKEILLYLFFGGITVILSVSIYAFQTQCMKVNELIANAIAWIICVIFQFFTNRIWVFQSTASSGKSCFRQMIEFTGGRLITLILEEIILAVFITWLSWNSLAVKLAAQIIVIVLNYIISKLVVFHE
ncbi:GtrA family protein [Agathobaculum sp. M2]|uniref:GtrA family protein n=2 Tax=Agathobaculum hominis TaxID=2763014 RepID=A0ABR7GQR6_9FIRM|nr:GtrA family protein [Agathobaculum hominis]